ncbi:family 16 glycoside hydrolase [Kineosporia mesophila]|uniref:family 16 glycoside hydrolase n=1 Tax=Kineosporia mesophila TaxID=566012 RepID=UPI0031EBCFC2
MVQFRARRRWQVAGVAGLVTLIGAGVTVVGAHAAEPSGSAFSADFESGSTSAWSKSGGTWAIATDGTKVLRQSNASSQNAREFAGDTSWTDYTVAGRVKPLSIGTGGFVGVLARAKSSTTFYRLALVPGAVQLQAVSSGTVTVLATSAQTVSNNTWYTLSLSVSGTTVTGSVNGKVVGTVKSSLASTGRIGLQTGNATASFDDLTVTTGSVATPTTTTTSAPVTTTKPAATATTGAPVTTTSSGSAVAGALYVSPKGTAGAAGTEAAPTTLANAITKVAAGGTIYLRGGTYSLSATQTIAAGNNGTASALKTISAYPGEKPVLDFSAMATADSNRGLALNGNYWHLYGFTVQKAGDNGIAVGGSHNTIERIVTAYNRDSGLQISRVSSAVAKADWPASNLVLSSESHDNADPDGEDADGFAAKLTVGANNVFRYTVSHNNIDDGWDLFAKPDTGAISPVTIEDSLSYGNGTLTNGTVNASGDRNGFKLGGSDIKVNHIVKRSIAYNNGHHGFTYNSNPGSMTIANNLSVDNAERNYAFDEGTSTFTSDTSCRFKVSGSNDKISGTADSSNQFYSGSNGSRCSAYSGAFAWSFDTAGKLVTTFGGKAVTF